MEEDGASPSGLRQRETQQLRLATRKGPDPCVWVKNRCVLTFLRPHHYLKADALAHFVVKV